MKKENNKIILLGVNFNELISGCKESSIKVPSGLSREERRKWALEKIKQNNKEF